MDDNGAMMYAVGRDTGNGGGWGGMNGWGDLAALLVVAGIFGGGFGGFGGYGGGAQNGYVLATDFATIERKIDGVNNGICSLGYEQLGQMNGINTNILQNGNETRQAIAQLGYNLDQKLCDIKYAMATDTCSIKQEIANGVSQILGYFTAEKISTLQAENLALKGKISQDNQTATIIGALRNGCGCCSYQQV